jgi:cobalamin biosynthesis Mg chelatase CobN
MDSGHQIKKDPKAAIRLVTQDTTKEGADKILGNCVKTFRSTYPDAVVRYAIASELVRQVMAGEGVGAGELVESSKWDDAKNLADVYVTWRGHAYDRKLKGEKMPELLKERLARLDVTVKNHNSRELDILDNDDDFMYHGGMVAGVKTYGDRDPLSVVGDSSDPDHLKTRTLEEKEHFIFRSRILNPK